MYTVKFQKRGLPHAHILIRLHPDNKLKTSEKIDHVISAELPHPDRYPELFKIVSAFMIHGTCGVSNTSSPCMKEGKCSKFYPKSFQNSTTIDDKGYPQYRRRDIGMHTSKRSIEVDNRSVIPYNPFLLRRHQAHVNVEYCNKTNSIMYLFKYVNKGPDRVTMAISNTDNDAESTTIVDEIKQYYDCRYLSSCEAVWRTFAFDILHRWSPV